MPRLKTPTQGSEGLLGTAIGGRNATAADFGVTGLEGIVDKVEASFAVIKDNAERANVSDIQAKLAQAQAEWTVNLAERGQSMQPGDTTFLPKFDEDLQKYLGETEQNLVSTEAGRRVFQKEAAQMRAHFFAQAGVMQAKAVGAKAVQDYGTLVDSFTRAVTIDPTQTDMLLQRAEAAINDPSGIYAKVPEPQRKELLRKAKEDISYGGAKGLILLGGAGPETALKNLREGRYGSMDPTKLDDLLGLAKSAIKEQEREKEHAEVLRQKARQEEQMKIMDGFLARITEPGKNGNGAMPTAKEIYGNPTLTPQQKEHYLNLRDRQIRGPGDGEGKNPATVRQLQEALVAPDGDPKKIYGTQAITEAFTAKKINGTEMQQLLAFEKGYRGEYMSTLAQAAKSVSSRTMRNMNASLGYLMQPDQLSAAQNQVEFDLQDAILARKAENKNPRDLLDPNSKDYFFTQGRMSTYFRTPQQSLAEGADKVKAGARSSSGPITQAPVAITTQAEWAKLPKGTIYQRPGMPPQVKQ